MHKTFVNQKNVTLRIIIIMHTTGFLKKDARFPKIKNTSDLLSDDEEG